MKKNHKNTEERCVAQRGRTYKGEPQHLELRPDDGKTNSLTTVAKDNMIMQLNPSRESNGRQPFQQNRIYDTDHKSSALCTGLTGGGHKIAEVAKGNPGAKSLTRLMKNMRDTDGKSHTFLAMSCKGAQANGMSLVAENLPTGTREYVRNPKVMTRKGTPVKDGSKSNALCVGGNGAGNNSQTVCVEKTPCRIRRLTPTECARLQTIPDWYKWNVSETQQYKMLGNGWTVEVIRHILSFLPENLIKREQE